MKRFLWDIAAETHGDNPDLKMREDPTKDSLMDVVERYGDVWFNGHDHNLQLIESNNTNNRGRRTTYITTGAGSSTRQDVRSNSSAFSIMFV